jgi:prepilin-type processing-associated H-X9-DG protein
VQLLAYLDQANKYQQFDFNSDINTSATNAAARSQDVIVFQCPSETSTATFTVTVGSVTEVVGRTSYLASLGANAWNANTNPGTGGVFFVNSKVRVTDITDGSSNTAMYAEVKRGMRLGAASNHPTNVTNFPFATWDASAANDLDYIPGCNTPTTTDFDYTGLQYYRAGVTWTAYYTHTITPNANVRDCVRATGLNKGHQAARSYHTGGVNVLLADGSVRWVSDSIALNVWKAVGTRGGNEVVGDW